MKLTNPTDEQLNTAFAEKVAGWSMKKTNPKDPVLGEEGEVFCAPGDGWNMNIPTFTQSADTVLPWLEKPDWMWCRKSHTLKKHGDYGYFEFWCYGPTKHQIGYHCCADEPGQFPRAAVIALLRAHGVEVEFTQ